MSVTVEWIKKHWEFVIGFTIALAVTVIGLFDLPAQSLHQKVTSSAILIVLGFLMASILRLRMEQSVTSDADHERAQVLATVKGWMAGQGDADSFLRADYPDDLRLLIPGCNSIDILAALSLRTTVTQNYDQIVELAKGGKPIRMLCPNPDDPKIMEIAALSSVAFRGDGSKVQRDVQSGLDFASSLRDELQPNHSVEIKVTNSLPAVGMVRLGRSNAEGDLLVKVMIPGSKDGAIPVFTLRTVRDSTWHRRFESSFNDLWDRSTPYKGSSQ